MAAVPIEDMLSQPYVGLYPVPAPMPGLQIGRIVHFVLSDGPRRGEHRPAIVVYVWNHSEGMVNLQVFTDSNGSVNDCLPPLYWRTSVKHDPDDKKPGTWHFPEGVERS